RFGIDFGSPSQAVCSLYSLAAYFFSSHFLPWEARTQYLAMYLLYWVWPLYFLVRERRAWVNLVRNLNLRNTRWPWPVAQVPWHFLSGTVSSRSTPKCERLFMWKRNM